MKRGANQIDWVISMFIFLLYLFWFFVIIKPRLDPPSDLNSLLSRVRDGFEADTRWQVDRAPLLFLSNETLVNYPIRFPAPAYEAATLSFYPQTYFAVDEGEVVLIGNITSQGVMALYHSDAAYAMPRPVPAIVADSSSATVPGVGIAATFDGALLKTLADNATRISDFALVVNGVDVPRDGEFDVSAIYAKHKLAAQGFNASTYLYLGRPEVWMTYRYAIDPPIITMTTQLPTYSSYESNLLYQGALDYSAGSCANFSADTIDFSDSLQFLFDGVVNLSLCAANTTLEFNATFQNLTDMHIILHAGRPRMEKTTPFEAILGGWEPIVGGRLENITALNTTPHAVLQDRYALPHERDFSLSVYTGFGTIASHGAEASSAANVYAETSVLNIVDGFGQVNSTRLTIRVW